MPIAYIIKTDIIIYDPMIAQAGLKIIKVFRKIVKIFLSWSNQRDNML